VPGNAGLETTTVLRDLPAVAHIGTACRLAVRGEPRRLQSVIRSIVLQLAANCGPAHP